MIFSRNSPIQLGTDIGGRTFDPRVINLGTDIAGRPLDPRVRRLGRNPFGQPYTPSMTWALDSAQYSNGTDYASSWMQNYQTPQFPLI